MSRNHCLPRLIVAWIVLSIGVAACGTGGTQQRAIQAQGKTSDRWSHQDWPTGHYRVVAGWPKPLPDTRHSHDGWTWGSFGGVYAENPDRIWVAMRGELPLPQGAAPWTPYAALNPSRAVASRIFLLRFVKQSRRAFGDARNRLAITFRRKLDVWLRTRQSCLKRRLRKSSGFGQEK